MSLQRGQSVPSPQLHRGESDSGALPPVGRSFGSGSDDAPFVRLNLLRALQMHRRLALGIALAGLVLAAAYVAKKWPVYTSQSQIYVQPVQSKLMAQGGEQTGPINPTAYDSYVQQQVQSATNPEVLMNALHKLGPGAWKRKDESEQVAAERLGRSIEVARVGTSYEVAITARAYDPGLSARIANAVATSIVERASGEGNAGDAQRIAVLREERDRIQNALKADYTEQDDLNKQLGMAAVGTAVPDLIDDEIGKTREELIKAQTDHDQSEARFAAMKAGQGNSSTAIDAEADDLIAADAGLTSMKTSLNQRRAVLISQMANLTPNNPEYKQHAEELAKINDSLDSMMKDLRANAATRIQEKLRTDLERTAGVEDRLNGQLRQLARTAASATPKLQRINDLATDIVRLRSRYSIVDEQLHNLMLEDSVPGAVHLSLAAVPPLHPTISGILKRALPLALGGLILGLLAASIANKLDPRVYIAADVEQVLGFAPTAVLPDFDEVSEEVAAEHLLRLSAAIEHARKQGELKSCIFTGAAAGTGVTTIANRVKGILEAMGRPTLLLDASGTPSEDSRTSAGISFLNRMLDEPATQRGSRSTALLKQVTAQTEQQQESLVLTDTAPLAISAETEYMARSVDGIIVVIESGVTTRAQLVAAVNILQRLEIGAVGFVLNRVGLAKADPAFRRCVHDMEKHFRSQSASTSMWPVRSRRFEDEPTPRAEQVWGEGDVCADAAPAVPEDVQETVSRRFPPAGSERAKIAPATASLPQPETARDEKMPWWLLDTPSQSAPAVSQETKPLETSHPMPFSPKVQAPALPAWFWEGASSGSGDFMHLPTAEEVHLPGEEENPFTAESRLNGLRGLLFSLGLKNLSKNRGTVPQDEESLPPPESESETTVLSRTFTPFAEPVPVSAAEVVTGAAGASAKQVVAQPEFLSPKEFVPIDETKRARASGSRARDDRGETYDEIQILPSRRGQYKTRS
jgi:polysaccharide biosynthesis transport protein